ncbi:MAG: CehA/McbA family metallohydrolase [Thermomicrobiales bacterium]
MNTLSSPDLVLTGQFAPEEQQTFRHVPLMVPPGVDQLHLRVRYNDQIGSDPRLQGGNTLDIGLFDEQGTESGGPGFRGWSGSNKLDITVGTEWSTPPYRAAKPGSGEWNVLLGAYKVGPNGIDYRIEIRFNPGLPDPGRPAIPRLRDLTRPRIERMPGWYCGDLHLHTVFSDGSSWPAEVALAAYDLGLDFIGITDHNRAQSPVEFVPQGDGWPLLVPGVEVTTYAGHFNVWGTDAWYDFRDPTASGIQAAVDAARADGGFISLNHPKPFGPPWEFPEVTGFDALEPWNGWWGRLNDVSTRYWNDRLARGERLWGLGGSDMHQLGFGADPENPLAPAQLGSPTLWIQTDEPLSATAVLDALRAGRSFITESPTGPQLYLELEPGGEMLRVHVFGARGDALILIGPTGVLDASTIDLNNFEFFWPMEFFEGTSATRPPYIRLEIHRAGGGVRALSNPIWLP